MAPPGSVGSRVSSSCRSVGPAMVHTGGPGRGPELSSPFLAYLLASLLPLIVADILPPPTATRSPTNATTKLRSTSRIAPTTSTTSRSAPTTATTAPSRVPPTPSLSRSSTPLSVTSASAPAPLSTSLATAATSRSTATHRLPPSSPATVVAPKRLSTAVTRSRFE